MSNEHEWHAARDMAHLTEHAGARQPCCEPILGRLSAIDSKHVRVLQFAYFRRSPDWLASVDLELEIGYEFATESVRRMRHVMRDAAFDQVRRVAGDDLLRAAAAAYEGRELAPPRQWLGARNPLRERSVYFVRGEGTGLIKIGVADDVDARLRSLQTGSPVRLTLLAVMRGNEGIEQFLHGQFAHLRQHGEWFREAPDLLAYIDAAKVRKGASTDSDASPEKST